MRTYLFTHFYGLEFKLGEEFSAGRLESKTSRRIRSERELLGIRLLAGQRGRLQDTIKRENKSRSLQGLPKEMCGSGHKPCFFGTCYEDRIGVLSHHTKAIPHPRPLQVACPMDGSAPSGATSWDGGQLRSPRQEPRGQRRASRRVLARAQARPCSAEGSVRWE